MAATAVGETTPMTKSSGLGLDWQEHKDVVDTENSPVVAVWPRVHRGGTTTTTAVAVR